MQNGTLGVFLMIMSVRLLKTMPLFRSMFLFIAPDHFLKSSTKRLRLSPQRPQKTNLLLKPVLKALKLQKQIHSL